MIHPTDERYYAAIGMMNSTSKFQRALGDALFSADRTNTNLIKDTWGSLWESSVRHGAKDDRIPHPGPALNFMTKLDERFYVVMGMANRGGSFVHKLATVLSYANPDDVEKIKETWPEYWKKYLELGKSIALKKDG